MIKVKSSGNYEAMFKQLATTEEMVDLVAEKIKLFQKNPDDTRLANHPLKRRMDGQWAFSITDDIRIVYEWAGKHAVRFLAIGGHEEVYA